MFYVTYNMQSSTTLLLLAGGFKGLMVYATFNIVLVIYRTCAIGRGVQEAHIFCHFQKCFSHLPLICCRQGGFRRLMVLPLSILFESFTAHVR